MTIVADPLIPLWTIYLIAALAAIISAFAVRRFWQSGVLRLLAASTLIALLANPLIRQSELTPLDDIAIIIADQSASQNLDGRRAIVEQAVNELQETLEKFDNVEVRRVNVTGTDETRLVSATRDTIANTARDQISAVFLVTDGQASDADSLELQRKSPAPVHILNTGSNSERDRKITLLSAPRYGLVRRSVRVSFRVDDLTANEEPANLAGSAIVTLRVNGEIVLTQPVPVGVEAGFDAPLTSPGETVIELEVEELRGELTTRNNIAILPISAIRDRLRVLLISGEPHAGERVWRNLLKSDPAVDLVHFTILRPIDKNDGTPISELALIPFPQDELFIDKLSEFDLLIFDRYTYRGVLSAFHFDNIARYVEQGGAVMISSGPEYNGALSLAGRRNLSFILPARPEGGAVERAFRPALSDLGERHPVTKGLPEREFWGRWLRVMPVRQERGQTLMQTPRGEPLLILDRVGEGRVGLLLSDHVWLWARGFDGGGPHAELLRRIAHWLMKEPELEEEALKLYASGPNLIIERRTMSDAAEDVDLTTPSGDQQILTLSETGEPGIFRTVLNEATPGLYRARAGELFAVGSIGLAAPAEFVDVVSTHRKLAPLSETSGGGAFDLRRGDRTVALPALRRMRPSAKAAGPGWAGVFERRATRVESIEDRAVAPPVVWLAVTLALLLSAWLIESGKRNPLSRNEGKV